jgi:crotonobetaine/carnitine-CoA ligase
MSLSHRVLPDLAPSLAAELRRAARDAPHQPFIRMAGGEWSYAQFDADTDRVAAGLHALGVRRGDNVSLMLPNCIEFAVLWFALAKLGAVTAPVNTSFRGQVLLNAINLVESRLLLIDVSLLVALDTQRPQLSSIEQILVVGGEPAPDCLRYETLWQT